MRENCVHVCVYSINQVHEELIHRVLSTCQAIKIIPPPRFQAVDAEVLEEGYLSKAELEALQAVANWGRVSVAARKLHRAPTTLKSQLRSVREKIGVATTVEAVAWALRRGLIR